MNCFTHTLPLLLNNDASDIAVLCIILLAESATSRRDSLNDLDCIRLISQGTVYDNLVPDRLEGPKALDPNY